MASQHRRSFPPPLKPPVSTLTGHESFAQSRGSHLLRSWGFSFLSFQDARLPWSFFSCAGCFSPLDPWWSYLCFLVSKFLNLQRQQRWAFSSGDIYDLSDLIWTYGLRCNRLTHESQIYISGPIHAPSHPPNFSCRLSLSESASPDQIYCPQHPLSEPLPCCACASRGSLQDSLPPPFTSGHKGWPSTKGSL